MADEEFSDLPEDQVIELKSRLAELDTTTADTIDREDLARRCAGVWDQFFKFREERGRLLGEYLSKMLHAEFDFRSVLRKETFAAAEKWKARRSPISVSLQTRSERLMNSLYKTFPSEVPRKPSEFLTGLRDWLKILLIFGASPGT